MVGGMMAAPTWRLAVDRRTGCLIVRGTEHDLRQVAEYLAVLDQADGQALSRLKNFRVFKLKSADVQQVATVLNDLDLNVAVVAVPGARMLAISGSEEGLKEVAEVIEALDVEGKTLKGREGDTRVR
jgi:type II secretory pathway component GspD/PulD (secretin)